jgi:RNA polymerase sigma-70 factor, ECF subfamily
MKAFSGLEEKLLLKRVMKGEKEAFAEVYDFYVVKIFRFVYLKTSSKETAEDITSEVFMKCWKSIQSKQDLKDVDRSEMETIGPLLYRIARNTIIDFYRKNQRLTVEIDDDMKDRIADQRQDISSELNLKQEIEDLMDSIRQLKDEYQEVLILKFVEDLPNSDIARITEKSEGSTRVLIHRALKSLEKALNTKENIRNGK